MNFDEQDVLEKIASAPLNIASSQQKSGYYSDNRLVKRSTGNIDRTAPSFFTDLVPKKLAVFFMSLRERSCLPSTVGIVT